MLFRLPHHFVHIMFTNFILPGLLIGIGAAVSPGPLLLLIIAETLRGGVRSGWSIAVAPLITDIPFIAVSIVLATGLGRFQPLVGIISLLGAAFLVFLAWQNIRITREDVRRPPSARVSLLKGVMTNLLGPYLYIFWFSIAVPIFARGNTVGSALFAASLLFASICSMMTVSVLVAVARTRFLNHLHWMIRGLSILLLLVAVMFVKEGIRLL